MAFSSSRFSTGGYFSVFLCSEPTVDLIKYPKNRDLTKSKGAGRLVGNERGIMRDLDPNRPNDTNIMKLARKRFLEFTSSPKMFDTNLDRVRREALSLVQVALEEGKKGEVTIDPKRITMEAATNAGFATATGFTHKQGKFP